jgi:deoxyribose-phosphate aldolase
VEGKYYATKMTSASEIAALIDHTLLRADAAEPDIRKLCEEALEFQFASVCVNPFWVPLCAKLLRGASSRVCTVISFPLGASATIAKICESEAMLEAGAEELDMVINIGALKSGLFDVVEADIRAVAETAHESRGICKVIIETSLLTADEKVRASRIAKDACADFVKTSTGFSTAGATAADVRLMRETVGATMGVKASGGIRTLEDLRAMVGAGANRIGSSSGVKILHELRNHQSQAATASGADSY